MFSVFGLMFFLAAGGVYSGRFRWFSGSLFLTRHTVYFSALCGIPCLLYSWIVVSKHTSDLFCSELQF